MTEPEALRLMVRLVAAFPRPEVSEATVDVYVQHLLPLDYQAARVAIARLVATRKFLPAIAEIRDAMTEQRATDFPTAGDAWALAMTWVRKIGGYGTPPETTPTERLVKRAIDGLGGWAYLCHESENLAADRARFLDGWDELVRRERTRTAHEVWPLPGVPRVEAPASVRELVTSLAQGMTVPAPSPMGADRA